MAHFSLRSNNSNRHDGKQKPRRRARFFGSLERLETRNLLAALIGVDFDVVTSGSAPRPDNWNVADFGTRQFGFDTLLQNNLIDELGAPTPVVLTITSPIADTETGVLEFINDESIAAATLPSRSDGLPTLENLGGWQFVDGANETITATWRNLSPFTRYDVYVFGLEGDGQNSSQSVSINDGEIEFTQSPTTSGSQSRLWINGQEGTTGLLDDFAVQSLPNANGQIEILVTATSPRNSAALGGLAIRAAERLPILVNATGDIDDEDRFNNQTTLREALAIANDLAGADQIVFDETVFAAATSLTLAGGELQITDDVTITGPGQDLLTIDANQQSRVINVTGGTEIDVTLEGLTITGGSTTGGNEFGGGILFDSLGGLTLTDSTVSGNSTSGDRAYGGGIFAGGSMTLTSSTLSGNSTSGGSAFGGGIFAGGSVTLTSSTLSGNSTSGVSANGGGIYAGGSVTLTSSTLSGNSTSGDRAYGGGILASSVTLTSSTLSGNSTSGEFASGGGIVAVDSVTLTSSTLSGNSTSGDRAYGGGILASSVTLTSSTLSGNSTSGDNAVGGGILANGSVTLTSSTLSGNSTSGDDAAGGGIYARNGSVTLTSSTLIDNRASGLGGGILVRNASLTIANSIVAGNVRLVDGNGANGTPNDLVPDPDGVLTVNHSLIGVADNLGTITGNVGNQTGTAAMPLDPQLGPLGNNGGPTRTHALLPGSPAIDAGSSDAAFDQRGLPRSVGGGVDIGAVEVPLPIVVNETGDAVTPTNGATTLREAIAQANVSTGFDLIVFDSTIFSGTSNTIVLSQGELLVTDTLLITGPGQDRLTINANEQSRVINVTGGTEIDVTLEGLTITGGSTTGDNENAETTHSGGGIRFDSSGTLTLIDSTVSGNSTSGFGAAGGGIFARNYSVTLTSSTLSGNSTSGGFARGGGIYAGGSVTLTNSTLSGNSTTGVLATGGGVFASNGSVTLTNSTLSGNSTSGVFADGGGIYSLVGSVTLTNSTLRGNSTSGDDAAGGGIYARNGSVTLTSSTLSGNSTSGDNAYGGGIFANGSVTLTSSTLSGNSTSGDDAAGGGISARNGSVTLTSSTLIDNRASGLGGGILVRNASVTIANSIVAGNVQLVDGNGANGTPNDLVPDPNVVLTVNHSLIGVADDLGTITGNMGNQTGTAAMPLDPQLGPLADNGGPTRTHAPLPGSPAIDGGNNDLAVDPDGNPLASDQRGAPFVRVADGIVDIGAYELQAGGSQFTRVTLGVDELLDLPNPLDYQLTDPIILDGVFRLVAQVIEPDETADIFAIETPQPWRNPIRPEDVDGLNSVTPFDALLVINEVSRRQFSNEADGMLVDPTLLLGPAAQPGFPDLYFDVNGSGTVTALDALLVINFLSRNRITDGEQAFDTGIVAGQERLFAQVKEPQPSFATVWQTIDEAIGSITQSKQNPFDLSASLKTVTTPDAPIDQQTKTVPSFVLDNVEAENDLLEQIDDYFAEHSFVHGHQILQKLD